MTTDAQAVCLPFEEAIQFFRQKANVKTQRWTDVWREAHSRSFMVAGAATDALVQDFREAIDKAISQGTTLAEFRKDFDEIVKKHGWEYNGGPGWRSRVIYETNLAGAYSAGRYAQMNDPDVREMYPFWMYKHGGSVHPRLQHLAWDGLTLRCDDAFWDSHYPPNGWRCSCYVIPQSEAQIARRGKDGPDTAPPIEMRTWVDKATGVHHQVPVGIDPGFDYNPGKAWLHSPVKSKPMEEARAAPQPLPGGRPHRPGGAEAAGAPRQYASAAEIDAVQATKAAPWRKSLTAEESDARDLYKGADGSLMNAVLNKEIEAPTLADQARVLHKALMRSTVHETVRTYRVIDERELAMLDGLKPGDVIERAGFTSTTLDGATAGRLLGEKEDGDAIEIIVPKGYVGAAYIDGPPRAAQHEFEMLIASGARFRYLGRAPDGRIVLEAI